MPAPACACRARPRLVPSQVHEKIRSNPNPGKKARTKPADAGKRWKTPKSTYEQKKANLKAKLAALADDE